MQQDIYTGFTTSYLCVLAVESTEQHYQMGNILHLDMSKLSSPASNRILFSLIRGNCISILEWHCTDYLLLFVNCPAVLQYYIARTFQNWTPLGKLFRSFKRGVLYPGIYTVLILLTWDLDRSVL